MYIFAEWLVCQGWVDCDFRRLPELLENPAWVISQHSVRFPQEFDETHLYAWVERGTVKVICCPWPCIVCQSLYHIFLLMAKKEIEKMLLK